MTLKFILKILLRPKFIVWQILAFITIIISTGVNVILPLAAGQYLDQYFAQGFISNSGIFLAILVLSLILIFPAINSYINSYVAENLAYELKNQLVNKVLGLTFNDYSKREQAKLFTILTNDVNVIKDTISRVISTLIFGIIMLIGSMVLMYRINSKVAIIIFIVVPLITISVVLIFRKVAQLFKVAQEARDSLNQKIDENIKAAMLVRVFVAEGNEASKFDQANNALYDVSLKIVKRISLVFPILNITMYLGQFIVLLAGGYEAIGGNMTIGDISAFNNYVVMFTMPFLILGFMATLIGQAFASLNRINSILTIAPPAQQPTQEVNELRSIELKDVSLKINDIEILKDLNFMINKGESIGIIGMTGSGKSIFTEVLLNFFADSEGTFLLNGLPISEVNYDLFRKQIGYVPQKNFILDDTIYNNIDFYRHISQEEIKLAAETAEVNEFCDKLPTGLGEQAGERGNKLSGGQKQRVTMARALASHPQLLILDDSTSKLDMATEQRIFDKLRKNYPDMTMIVIAQKIASIKNCDRIYVMEKGTFEVNGTHQYLIDNSDLYHEIDLTQSNYSH